MNQGQTSGTPAGTTVGITASTTAHQHWDQVWRTGDGRADWSTVDPWVAGTVGLLRERRARTVLDLACGVGRHAVFLARSGFRCWAVDASPTAVEHTRAAAEQAGVDVDLRIGQMNRLPYPDGHFDYVLAYNAIYHGDPEAVRATVQEIHRVLRPGGLYQVTMLSRRNRGYGQGVEVAEGTFVRPDADDDKVHPHFYCDAAGLVTLNRPAEPLSIHDAEHSAPGSFHWHCLFETPAGPERG
ncbi:class I SAM-dependent methyltransferase [Streptosporangium jomthongense]|uniref:Class I SAM-dependent methyltransferase n=1 Tax=Streptosporangium jomthongense TaxID=1193683 RepID=A0ABV8EUU7_9ACTN